MGARTARAWLLLAMALYGVVLLVFSDAVRA